MDSLVAALRRQMLDTFPDSYIPDRDQLGREPMDPLVGRYLEEELDRRVDQELNRLAYEPSDWVTGERRDFVDRAHRNLRASITSAVSFPAPRWEALIDQATRVVCSFVVRPVTTSVAELFQLGADTISGSTARSRLRALAGHPELSERADRWLAGADEPIRRGAFAHAMREIAESVVAAEEFWVTATDSLFALHQRVNGKRAVPPARLRALYDDLGLRHLAERIADVESAGLSYPWTETMLLQAFALQEEDLEPPTLFDAPVASATTNTIVTNEAVEDAEATSDDWSNDVRSSGEPAPPVGPAETVRPADIYEDLESPIAAEPAEPGETITPAETITAVEAVSPIDTAFPTERDEPIGDARPLERDEHEDDAADFAGDTPGERKEPEADADGEEGDGVPLWRRFQTKLNAPMAMPHPDSPALQAARRDAAASGAGSGVGSAGGSGTATRVNTGGADAATTEKSTRPLWERYRKPTSEVEISTESPADFADLEQFVLGPLDNASRTAFVETLFNGRPAEYRELVRVLAETETWPEATTTIANEVFRRNRVNIYSEIAIRFTNAVERRFKR